MYLLKKAILNTIIYADIFDFPLRKSEIWQYLMIHVPSKRVDFDKEMHAPNQKISENSGYFSLQGREKITLLRKKRIEVSEKKLFFARKIANLLKIIPTIELIGVSGSLAMLNAKENDDIDMFIISSSGTVWMTRCLVTIFLDILGIRRKKHETYASNKICLNMFMDKKSLSLPFYKHTNYIAHEIAQMKVLVDKHNTYAEFLFLNSWVKQFLFNTTIPSRVTFKKNTTLQTLLMPLEFIFRIFQENYMQKHKNHEIITSTLLAFHPLDRETYIQKEFRKRVKKYEI